ncbi:hypothetical protein CEXT_340131 [Caerostris extrusa]|uniref:LAGLIDADG homing endonuclease n=1 Tax=Caerostris extrusa TaxID=172846 RepID=A0AAV4PCB9_CAEEX|nr:hypothetical protein CEXT_340131 [Caerostris extrusa]
MTFNGWSEPCLYSRNLSLIIPRTHKETPFTHKTPNVEDAPHELCAFDTFFFKKIDPRKACLLTLSPEKQARTNVVRILHDYICLGWWKKEDELYNSVKKGSISKTEFLSCNEYKRNG